MIPVDGQSTNPGPPSLRECTARTYGSANWLSQLPGFPASRKIDSSSSSDSDGIDSDDDAPYRDNGNSPGTHSTFGIDLTTTLTTRGGAEHHIVTQVIPGLAADRSEMFAIGDSITRIDLTSTKNASTEETNKPILGPIRSRMYVSLSNTQGRPSTARVHRGAPIPRTVSWSKAIHPLRTRRHEIVNTKDKLNDAESKELESLKKGERSQTVGTPSSNPLTS